MLPPELISQIVLFSGDRTVASTLLYHSEPNTWKFIKSRVLVYGQVQSGKSAYIMKIIQKPKYTDMVKILIIQNTLLALDQYKKRFIEKGINFQVIDKTTTSITGDVIIIMNNKYRLGHYNALPNKPIQYIIIMDESDMYKGKSVEFRGKHILATQAITEYYVTATPLLKKYEGYFDKILTLKPKENYYGLNRLELSYINDPTLAVENFMKTTSGIMLVNSFSLIGLMKYNAQKWSNYYPNTPVIVLSTEKTAYLNHECFKLKTSLSKIIDSFHNYPRILIIANRLSMRGLSYTSSDYSKHLTHQYTDLRANITNSLQKLRILGNYVDFPNLQLSLPENNEKIVQKMLKSLTKTLTVTDKQFECLSF